MHAKLLSLIVASLFVSGAALAQSAAPTNTEPMAPAATQPAPARVMPAERAAKMQQRFDRMFAKMDKNSDGMLSRDELTKNKRLSKHFDEIDANKDGNISKDELQTYFHNMREQQKVKFDAQFKAADKNGDGALTKEEAEAGKLGWISKHFDKIDANKDGKVTREEIRAYMMSRHKQQHEHG